MSAATPTSAAPFLALLAEDEPKLKVLALTKLDQVVHQFWPEVAEKIESIEVLYENESFPNRELAALVASKVFYHLGVFPEAMSYALRAGALFDMNSTREYEETLVGKFIDEYISKRTVEFESASSRIDPLLVKVAERMFERCFNDGKFKQALGIAIESRRLDMIEQSIVRSGEIHAMLRYTLSIVQNAVASRVFREQVLRVVVNLYEQHNIADYLRISQCLVTLGDSKAVAEQIVRLLDQNTSESTSLALQIAFDLYANATQQFLRQVREHLPQDDTPAPAEGAVPSRLAMIQEILMGTRTIGIHLEFLHRNNHSDLSILKNIKEATDSRSSVIHNALAFANSLMHAGTTSDAFLRENFDWFSKATNWAKFSATAGIGVIHKGHLKESRTVLEPYLPRGTNFASPYSEGGALYAMGLIHANHGDQVSDYLLKTLESAAQNETVAHGACLGLGLAAMATGNDRYFATLKDILYTESAVAGEAAGIAMGLVMLGSANPNAIEEMMAYAHETQHEKIIRGLAIGLALIMYEREEQADALVQQLLLDKDPILRYGACYTIALAYSGTANNGAIRHLLHLAVSDVSDDVRRAAVTCLGFLLYNDPEQCPRLVSLLAESYNPHVRYGAALALGFACAGTGLKSAVELLDGMTADPVDFVRQGALISLAMILIQRTKAQEPKMVALRKMFQDKVMDKHEEILCKFGAILASGIIDAGGRNVTIALNTRSGHRNMLANVGLAVFAQYWYWFPFVHFFSLSFQPTAIIGLNNELQMPVFKFRSNAKPSLFAYPPEVKPVVAKQATKVATAVLSFSRKKPRGRLDRSRMDVDPPAPSEKEKAEQAEKEKREHEEKEKQEANKDEANKEEVAEPEPEFEIKENPARITPAQQRHVTFDVDERYRPIVENVYGIVLLKDTKPDSGVVLVEAKPPPAPTGATEEPEPSPPEDFEWKDE